MYAIDAHRVTDRATLVSAMRELQFATLFTAEGGLTCSQIPFTLHEDDDKTLTLVGHLARANPHWRAIGAGTPALVLFQGPQAYISPSWYPTKADTGKVVPTWAYIAIEVKGTLETIADADDLRAMLTAITMRNETGRPEPWEIEDAPADYIARLMRAIVGVRLRIDAIEGVWKLNQAKSEADQAGTARGLAGEPAAEARALAHLVLNPPPRA